MQRLGLFRYLQPTLYAGLLDDPVLLVNVRPTGRSLLFDCGQIHHLAKRVLRAIDAVFISHAHMDHFMGFDHLLRNNHVAPRTLRLFGPPGIADRVEHKLSGYDWNLAEENWCTFEVSEVHPDRLVRCKFKGSAGFRRGPRHSEPRTDTIIYRQDHLQVRAELGDHKLPVLMFRVTEREAFLVDRQRLTTAGLIPGPWLRELKRRYHAADWGQDPVRVPKRTDSGDQIDVALPAAELYRLIKGESAPASIGYLSDLGMTAANLERIATLFAGVTLLVSECTFLAADEDKARKSFHLCTTDLNRITRLLRPRYLLPVHLGKAYLNATDQLYAELELPPQTRLLSVKKYQTPRPLLPEEITPPVDRG